MPGRNCQWLHRSCITIADVPSRNCQCMCKRTVKRPHSEGVPFWKKRVPNDPITVGVVLVVSSLNHSIVRFFISVWVLLVSQFKLGPRTLPRATKYHATLTPKKKTELQQNSADVPSKSCEMRLNKIKFDDRTWIIQVIFKEENNHPFQTFDRCQFLFECGTSWWSWSFSPPAVVDSMI